MTVRVAREQQAHRGERGYPQAHKGRFFTTYEELEKAKSGK
jgi:hypothetical protein